MSDLVDVSAPESPGRDGGGLAARKLEEGLQQAGREGDKELWLPQDVRRRDVIHPRIFHPWRVPGCGWKLFMVEIRWGMVLGPAYRDIVHWFEGGVVVTGWNTLCDPLVAALSRRRLGASKVTTKSFLCYLGLQ